MKNILKRLFIAGCITYTAASMIIGCASTNPNAGQVTYATNAATGSISTNVEPPVIPNKTVTQVAQTAGQIAPLIPPPYGDLLALLATGALTVAGAIAKAQNNKAAAAVNANTQTTAQLNAVIQGVEQGTSGATVTAATVKQAIQSRATAAGVQPALDAKVQSLTT